MWCSSCDREEHECSAADCECQQFACVQLRESMVEIVGDGDDGEE
jgi:hypothetical protein